LGKMVGSATQQRETTEVSALATTVFSRWTSKGQARRRRDDGGDGDSEGWKADGRWQSRWRMVGFGCQEGPAVQNPMWMGVSACPFGTPRVGVGTGLPAILLGSKTSRLLLERADVAPKQC
jgi:hypothetical protein